MKTITASIDNAGVVFSRTTHIRRRSICSLGTIICYFGYYDKDGHGTPIMVITFRLVSPSTATIGARSYRFTEQVVQR